MFERQIHARWGDMDFNGHMKNTAYLDAAADLRMVFFADHGFSMREFDKLRFGPVITRDELEYFRELRLLDPIRVTLEAAGLSADGTRFLLINEFYRADGKIAARVTSHGGWLNLDARKWTAPPEELRRLMESMPRRADFRLLSS